MRTNQFINKGIQLAIFISLIFITPVPQAFSRQNQDSAGSRIKQESNETIVGKTDQKKFEDQQVQEEYEANNGEQEELEKEAKFNNVNNVPAHFDQFPNLHPLFVHFPIVLLLLAFLSQLISLFYMRISLSKVTLALLAGAFIGAIFAAEIFHAHPENLDNQAREVFETHMHYAMWTLWLSGIALLLKILSHFVFRAALWSEIIVAIFLIAPTFTVCMAGHLGSQLVYIEGVGPKGNHVELHHHGGEEHEHE